MIHFDYIRLGDFSDAKKNYRNISHAGAGKNFFANKEIWEQFSQSHSDSVNPISTNPELESVEAFMAKNPEFETKLDAALARDQRWKNAADPLMRGNFRKADHKLELEKQEREPYEYLTRALDYLQKIDLQSNVLLADDRNRDLVRDINSFAWEAKKKFDRKRQ